MQRIILRRKTCRLSQKQVIRRKIRDYHKKYDRIDAYQTKDRAAVAAVEKEWVISKERNRIFQLQGKSATNDFANEKREKESGRLDF